MSRPTLLGRQFSATVRGIAATTATALVLKSVNDDTITLAEGDRISITSILCSNVATAKTVTVFQDLDADNAFDAGEEIVTFEFSGQDSAGAYFPLPHRCVKINAAGDNDLMVIASTTGNIDLTVVGAIVSG